MDIQLDLYKAYDNEHTKVLVTNGSSDPDSVISFSCMLTSPISLGNTASFTNLMEGDNQEAVGKMLENIKANFGNVTKIPMNLPSPKTAQQTVSSWSSTEKLSFTLHVSFLSLKKDDDVRKKVKEIYKAVYPVFDSSSKDTRASFMYAPLKYQPLGLRARNTMTVSIGKWFKGTGFLMKSVNFEFSKEILKNGTPLYAEGQIEFEHYRIISYKEFSSMLDGEGEAVNVADASSQIPLVG